MSLVRGKEVSYPFNVRLGSVDNPESPDSIVEAVVIVNGLDTTITTTTVVTGDVVMVRYAVPADAEDGDSHSIRLVIEEGGKTAPRTEYVGAVGVDISSIGDGVSVIVPGIAHLPDRFGQGNELKVAVCEEVTITVPVLSPQDQPIDLTALGDLWFGVDDRNRNNLFHATPTGGIGSFSVQIPKQPHCRSRLRWALRVADSGKLIVDGNFEIQYAPSPVPETEQVNS